MLISVHLPGLLLQCVNSYSVCLHECNYTFTKGGCYGERWKQGKHSKNLCAQRSHPAGNTMGLGHHRPIFSSRFRHTLPVPRSYEGTLCLDDPTTHDFYDAWSILSGRGLLLCTCRNLYTLALGQGGLSACHYVCFAAGVCAH